MAWVRPFKIIGETCCRPICCRSCRNQLNHPDTRKADYSGLRWEGQCAVNIGFGLFHCHVPTVPVPHPLLFRTPTSLTVELNMKDRTETLEIGSSAPDFSLAAANRDGRSEEHTSDLQSLRHLVCLLLLER